jgi:hypothetical protein
MPTNYKFESMNPRIKQDTNNLTAKIIEGIKQHLPKGAWHYPKWIII